MGIRDVAVSDLHTEIRQELSATRLSFHRLLAQIPDGALEAPTANPAWNVRELLYHVILAPELLPQDLRLIGRNVPLPVSPELFNWANLHYTRWRARKATVQTIGQHYDLAHQHALTMLDRLSPQELLQTAAYPVLNNQMSGGRTSVADLYHYLTLHFGEHAVDILAGIERWRQAPALVKIVDRQPPRGWQRAFFRMPIWLYQNNLGWLLGGRFLLLQHLGRRSGQQRQTVLEVVDYDHLKDVYTVASGWGNQADWYRNLRAHPQAVIQVGRRRLAVAAEFLSPPAAGEAMVQYARRHPQAAKSLAQLLGYRIKAGTEGYRALGQEALPFVRLSVIRQESG